LSIDVEGLKARIDLVAVVGSYVSLKKRAGEYLGLCPFHADKNPSFYVIPQKGFCKCFSCGWSGDVLDFMQEKNGVDFKAAAEMLGATDEWKPAPITQSAPPLPERITSKPPADAPECRFTLRQLGEPTRVWPYLDTDGGLLGYVTRYDPPEGKQIRVWSWGARGDAAPAWGCGHWNKPRPLYGLDRLAARPNDPVMVVEGEKAADAAGVLLPSYVCVSWPGGAQAWRHVDYSALRGRRVDFWPDNDTPGREAMAGIAALISDPRGLDCHGKTINPDGMPDGFDAADWTPELGDIAQWASQRISWYREQSPAPQAAADKAKPSEPESVAPADAGPSGESPPLEAYAADVIPITKKSKRKPRARSLEGNAAPHPDPDETPLPQAMSEDALASHFVDEHGDNWRFVRRWASWFEWDGDGWRQDETGKVDSLAVMVTRQSLYWPEAAALTPKERRQVNKRSTAGAVRDIASSNAKIAARMDQWDTDPWLLGCPGGVLDLKFGKMLEAEREQYITKRCAIAPATGQPARWLEFLKRVTGGDQSLIDYLQRFSGYSLTGDIGEHSLAFLYGTGANGKTVFLQTLSGILGDYAVSAGIETFTETKNERHSTEIARLRGARLVVTEETDSGGRWAEGKIKRLTGGGTISAHFMRQDDFEFVPQFKLLVAGNHKPQLRSVDEAIRRRFHMVPFAVTIPVAERDHSLMDKLKSEWPQILGWMLEGCVSWQDCGLGLPEAIQDATDQYLLAEDILGQWISDCCDREGEHESALLYRNYCEWCEKQGERAWSRRSWANALVDRGFGTGRTNSMRTIVGLRPFRNTNQ